jgi:hypothetical protein
VVNGKCQWKGNMYRYYLQWWWGDQNGNYGSVNDNPSCTVWPGYSITPSGWTFVYEAPYRYPNDSCFVPRLIGNDWNQRNYKIFYKSFILNVWDSCRVWMKTSDLGKSNISNNISLCLWNSECGSLGTIDWNWDCK